MCHPTRAAPAQQSQGDLKYALIPSQDKASDKKVQTKGKRGAKGKQAEVTKQEMKEDLPAENGETKSEEVRSVCVCVCVCVNFD